MTDLTPPTEATPAEPLRDPRPWEVCTRGSIRKGDLVDARVDDRLYLGVAYHQDEDGDWWTEGGVRLTWGDPWTLRRLPAPTPPAVKILSALEFETMRVERAECAAAGMPASDHPVVQRAARVLDAAHSKSSTTSAHLSILTALSHLTADDLRNTDAGRELMAEAWDERHATRPNYSQGHDDDCMGWEDCHCGRYLNPYRKADA